jgi:hypothetical protein
MNGVWVSLAKFKFGGITEYTETLERLGKNNTEKILKYAVYPAAGIVADAITDALGAHHKSGELEKSVSLTAMRNDNGYVYTKVHFSGYDTKKKSKAFPNGVPNAVKAASLESGNSRGQDGTHIISKTVKSVTERAISEMQKALDEKIGQIMEAK